MVPMDYSRANLLTELMASAGFLAVNAIEASWSDEQWSPITILGHVSDVDEQVWHARIHLMVNAFHEGLPTPSFSWWEPDTAATQLKYRDYSLEQATARLFTSRSAIIETLSNLSDDDWNASATHSTFGKLTLPLLPEKILLHDQEHLESLQP